MQSSKVVAKYFERASFTSYLLLLSLNLYRLYDNDLPVAVCASLFLTAFILGYILSDFVSGVIHWLADRYGSIRLKFFGPQFILPFRAHHIFPQDMTKLRFLENIGNSCFFLAIFMGIFFALSHPPGSSVILFFLTSLVVVFSGVLALANLFHKWAHSARVPRMIQVLQKYHLVLPPVHHNTHHVSPYETHYCIVSGWCNSFLRKVQFFERVEKAIFSLFGVKGGDYDLADVQKEYQALIDTYFDRDK